MFTETILHICIYLNSKYFMHTIIFTFNFTKLYTFNYNAHAQTMNAV